MGNHSYQTSSIIGGVSRQEYSLRLDSQALAQSNCSLSAQYGLCKRPASHWFADAGILYGLLDYFMTVIYHGHKEYLLLLTPTILDHGEAASIYDTSQTHTSGEQGRQATNIAHWPRVTVTNAYPAPHTITSFERYLVAGGPTNTSEDTISSTTVGDVTFINNSLVQPFIMPATWKGYNERVYFEQEPGPDDDEGQSIPSTYSVICDNEDIFTVWVKDAASGDVDQYNVNVKWLFSPPGTGSSSQDPQEVDINVTLRGAASHDPQYQNLIGINTDIRRAYPLVASYMAYQLQYTARSQVVGSYQAPQALHATNLITNSTLDPNGWWWDVGDPTSNYYHFEYRGEHYGAYNAAVNTILPSHMHGATSCITCRYTGPTGEPQFPGWTQPNYDYPLLSVSVGDEDSNLSLCWKTVKSIADLPPRSWEDHTVEITADEESEDSFYMRFVSDEHTPTLYSTEHRYPTSAGVTGFNGMYPTKKLPRTGHWEEYIGVDIEQDIMPETMPHLLVKRPSFLQHHGSPGVTSDLEIPESFVSLPGAGAFAVNKGEQTLTFYSNSTAGITASAGPNGEEHLAGVIRFTLDTGFTQSYVTDSAGDVRFDVYPLIVGDTVRFENPKMTDAEIIIFTSWMGYEFDKEYYIVDIHNWNNNVNNYMVTVQLSEFKGGTPISFSYINTDWFNFDMDLVVTTYEKYKWTSRLCGDDNTNPLPSFFDRPIQNISTFQDRLVLSTDSEVTFSGTGDYFNFFRTTVRDLIDADPFSLVPATDDGSIIKQVKPFKGNMVVLTNTSQHIIQALDGAFSPNTASILPATKATADFFVKPASIGDSLYFPYTSSRGTGMWQLSPSSKYNNQFTTTDITTQVPGYLPSAPYKIVGSDKYNSLFLLPRVKPIIDASQDEQLQAVLGDFGKDQSLFVYNWLDTQKGRTQSAWTEWKFSRTWDIEDPIHPNDYKIKNIAMGVNRLYMLTQSWYKYEFPGPDEDGEGPDGDHTYPPRLQFNLEYIDLDLESRDNRLHPGIQVRFNNILIDRKTIGNGADEDSGDIGINFSSGDTTLTLPWQCTEDQFKDLVVVTAGGTVFTHNSNDDPNAILNPFERIVQEDHDSDNPPDPIQNVRYYDRIRMPDYDITIPDEDGDNWFWVGFRYDMISAFGPFAPQINEKPIRGRNIFMRGARLTYSQAYQFKINQINGSQYYSQLIDAGDIPGTNLELGPGLTNGELYFGLRYNLPDLEYVITNQTPWNAMFQGLMYDMNVQEIKPEYTRGMKGR